MNNFSGKPTLTIYYWITAQSTIPTFARDRLRAGYNVLSYTPFSPEAAWTRLHPDQIFSNTISVHINKTNPQKTPSQTLSMSKSSAPTKPPAHGSPSNNTVDPTLALIALIQKLLQQNATTITQINSRSSPHPPQTQSFSYQFKPQHPPFPKWDGTLTTTSLFLAQIETYKDEAFYTSFHDWTQTTPTIRQLSVAISLDILASLLSSISLIFLNYAKFASDGIAMLSYLITHLNPSYNENIIIAITDLTCFETRLGKSSNNYMSRVRGIT